MQFLLKDSQRKNVISKGCHSQKRPTRMLSVLSPPCKWAKVTNPGQLHILLPFQRVLRVSVHASPVSEWTHPILMGGVIKMEKEIPELTFRWCQLTAVFRATANSQLCIRSRTHFVPLYPNLLTLIICIHWTKTSPKLSSFADLQTRHPTARVGPQAASSVCGLCTSGLASLQTPVEQWNPVTGCNTRVHAFTAAS